MKVYLQYINCYTRKILKSSSDRDKEGNFLFIMYAYFVGDRGGEGDCGRAWIPQEPDHHTATHKEKV